MISRVHVAAVACLASALALAIPGVVGGQQAPGEATGEEAPPSEPPRETGRETPSETTSTHPFGGSSPWALFSVRYDTRTSDFIYAAYGYGQTFAMVGALQNPRSGYTELLAAVGRTFTIGGGPTQTAAIGAARASDSWYIQLYYLPALHRGPVWVRATAEWYLPLSSAGTVQFAVSPLSATAPIFKLVEAGVAMDVAAARGDATTTAIGPEVRLALPKAVLGTDVQRVLGEGATRLRVFFMTSF